MTTSALARSPHYISTSGTKAVELQLIPGKYVAALKTALGIDTTAPTAATDLIGVGRRTALQFGCFGVTLVYARTATKKQSAKVLCSPGKADTVFAEKAGGKYGTYDIKTVRVPQRRIFAI